MKNSTSTPRSRNEKQLQLKLSEQSFSLLNDLFEKLDATSAGEVIRRAMQCRAQHLSGNEAAGPHEAANVELCRQHIPLHVRVSATTRQMIDDACKKEGKPIASIIAEALEALKKCGDESKNMRWTGVVHRATDEHGRKRIVRISGLRVISPH